MTETNHHSHDHDHEHGHHHDHGQGHTHGLVDPSIIRSREGVRAVTISFAVLLIASVVQLIIFVMSGSVALLTDVIHNAGDSLTAIPLGLAFWLKSKKGEHLAGYIIVAVIFLSALIALYQAIDKIIHPHTPTHLLALLIAGLVGIIGNELAAVIRWRAGKRLDSPALIADGNHARADGIVSAGVVLSAVLIGIGWPIADPIIGLVITGLIFQSSWQSLRTIRNS
jgi:cation diffusion facilitator family transporter